MKIEGVLESVEFQVEVPMKLRTETVQRERFESWTIKPLHSQILRQTEDVRDKTSWNWMQKGDLKKETEG